MTRLSELSGLSLSYISLLEQGKREDPSLESLNKIATALDLEASLLLLLSSTQDENKDISLDTLEQLKKIIYDVL